MSTLAEIEAAVETLPGRSSRKLLASLAEKIGSSRSARVKYEDAFVRMIGAFAGPSEATGRKAEEILYGSPE
jgi:hypothetical protein